MGPDSLETDAVSYPFFVEVRKRSGAKRPEHGLVGPHDFEGEILIPEHIMHALNDTFAAGDKSDLGFGTRVSGRLGRKFFADLGKLNRE